MKKIKKVFLIQLGFTHCLRLAFRVSLLPIHTALIPGSAGAPDQAPLYQRRSRRMDKKRKTQATTTSEFLKEERDRAGKGIPGGREKKKHAKKRWCRYPIFLPRHVCGIMLFFGVLFQLSPVFSGRGDGAAVCAPISGQQHWRGCWSGRDHSDSEPAG